LVDGEMPEVADDVHACDGVATVGSGDVLFVLWKLAPTVERYDWFESRLDEFAAQQASFVICQLILPTSTPPNARIRARTRETLARLRPKLRRVVSVPLGDALWMSVVRVVMRGMAIVTGHAETSTIASTLHEGLDQVTAAASSNTPGRADFVVGLGKACAALGLERRAIGL
jgi:hypothetical protein